MNQLVRVPFGGNPLAGENARLTRTVARLERRERARTLIDELSETLWTCSTPPDAYPRVGAAVMQLFPSADGALAVPMAGANGLQTVAAWGRARSMADRFGVDDCCGLRRRGLHISAGPGDAVPCRHFNSPPAGGHLCLPLAVRDEPLGLLHLGAAVGHHFDNEQQRLALVLGKAMSLSLAELRLHEELWRRATRDPLTGLYNRRHLAETLQRECGRAARRDAPLSVAMVDVDCLKTRNDTFGHEAGDAVLKELGALLRGALRASDIACRYGGDEFVVVLLDTDAAMALPRLEQIRRDVASRQWVHDGQRLPAITVSVGLAQFPVHGTSPEALLRAADRAVYGAKNAGRNGMAVAP